MDDKTIKGPWKDGAGTVRTLIRDAGFKSIRSAAEYIGMNHVTLTDITHGKRPTEESCDKIAKLAERIVRREFEVHSKDGTVDENADAYQQATRDRYRKTRDRLRYLAGFLPQDLAVAAGIALPTDMPALPSTPGDSVAEVLRSRASLTHLPAQVIDAVTQLYASLQSETVRIPVISRVSAGGQLLNPENVEDYLFISRDLCRAEQGDQCFAVRVAGRSMEGDYILDGDLLIVRPQQDAEDGQLVIAWVSSDPDSIVVKRLRKRPGANWLESHWIDGTRDRIDLGHDARILGRVLERRSQY